MFEFKAESAARAACGPGYEQIFVEDAMAALSPARTKIRSATFFRASGPSAKRPTFWLLCKYSTLCFSANFASVDIYRLRFTVDAP
jgi:hypothetical protein